MDCTKENNWNFINLMLKKNKNAIIIIKCLKMLYSQISSGTMTTN